MKNARFRQLKVSKAMRKTHRRLAYYHAVPEIRLSGLWLAEHFSINDTVQIVATADGLIIKKIVNT